MPKDGTAHSGLALLHQFAIKKMPRWPSDGGNSSVEFSTFKMPLVCVRLMMKTIGCVMSIDIDLLSIETYDIPITLL